MKLQFLTMAGCHACAEVKKIIEEIDIARPEGQKLVQKYGIMSSPGIIIEGELFSTGGLNKEKLVEKLEMKGE